MIISKSKLLSRYLPLFLSVILIVGAAFAYQVFVKNNREAQADGAVNHINI